MNGLGAEIHPPARAREGIERRRRARGDGGLRIHERATARAALILQPRVTNGGGLTAVRARSGDVGKLQGHIDDGALGELLEALLPHFSTDA